MNKVAARKKQQFVNDNAIESLSLRGAVAQSLKNDLIKKSGDDAARQLEPFLGVYKSEAKRNREMKGDLVEGQELILSTTSKIDGAPQEESKLKLDIAPGIDYRREVLEGDKKIAKEDMRLVERQIEEIVVEIQKLSHAQKELEIEFREVAVEQRIVSPGKYHVNFFEWILSVIRLARMKIEDSGAWLAAFQSKKAKRQYWAMFKKHGTTFGLSNERVVATQTG